MKTMILLLLCLVCPFHGEAALEVHFDDLYNQIRSGQYAYDQDLHFPLLYKQIKGLWVSYGKVNTHGDEELKLLRRLFAVPDNNGFVTAWIVELLLEAHELGRINLNDDMDTLTNALHALEECRDKNQPPQAPVYAFWSQIQNQYGIWEEHPTNFVEPLSEFNSVDDAIYWVLTTLGLQSLWDKLDLKLINQFVNIAIDSFVIPSDFDDSAVHLTMGLKLRDHFPSVAADWWSRNSNVQVLSKMWTQFAYQPYSSDVNVNSIDPRTYFWIRGFVQKYEGTGPLRLIATWTSNLQNNNQTMHKGIKMPFNSNNVDASVVANGVLGLITSALKMTPQEFQSFWTPELEGLLLNSTNLLSWTMETGICLTRADIVLLYYPPIYNFYWFTARSLVALRNNTSSLPILDTVKNILQKTLEGTATQQILSLRVDDPSNPWTYWDDFLGNNDTINGVVENSGEDRLYSTAIALNALMDIWSAPTDSCKRQWLPNTPQEVKTVTTNAATFLNKYILASDYLPENCFFSGSMKGVRSLPYYFPGNKICTLNGTVVPPVNESDINEDLTDVVSGVIDEETYLNLLNQQWFGQDVPTTFPGFNGDGVFFPFWSSPPFTYAAALTGLAKWETATVCVNQ
uniref:Uncharacterized protein n=1 Tax=Arcella intermedia TaxID=1963864 RepID=A0A6B2KZS4_9EUKA